MAGTKNPPIDVPGVDLTTGKFVPDWFDRLKYLDGLDPLSSIDYTALLATIAGIYSPITRAINAQTGTSYTFALTDAGKFCSFANGSAVTVTVPPNGTIAFPVGTQIDVAQTGAGKTTFAQGVGVTINSLSGNKALSGQYAGGTLLQTAANVWLLVGSLTA